LPVCAGNLFVRWLSAAPSKMVYEPFFSQEGYIVRTPRGREATEKAYMHLNRKWAKSGQSLF